MILRIVPSAVTTIGLAITLKFHSFLALWQGLSICLPFRFFFLTLVRQDSKIY